VPAVERLQVKVVEAADSVAEAGQGPPAAVQRRNRISAVVVVEQSRLLAAMEMVR
jgi:hypothetical protein